MNSICRKFEEEGGKWVEWAAKLNTEKKEVNVAQIINAEILPLSTFLKELHQVLQKLKNLQEMASNLPTIGKLLALLMRIDRILASSCGKSVISCLIEYTRASIDSSNYINDENIRNKVASWSAQLIEKAFLKFPNYEKPVTSISKDITPSLFECDITVISLMSQMGFHHQDMANAICSETIQFIKQCLERLELGIKLGDSSLCFPHKEAISFEKKKTTNLQYPILNIQELSELIFPLIEQPDVFPLVVQLCNLHVNLPPSPSNTLSPHFLSQLTSLFNTPMFPISLKISLWNAYNHLFLSEFNILGSLIQKLDFFNIPNTFEPTVNHLEALSTACLTYSSLFYQAMLFFKQVFYETKDFRLVKLIRYFVERLQELKLKEDFQNSYLLIYFPPYFRDLANIFLFKPFSPLHYQNLNLLRKELIQSILLQNQETSQVEKILIPDIWFLGLQFFNWVKEGIQLLVEDIMNNKEPNQNIIEYLSWYVFPSIEESINLNTNQWLTTILNKLKGFLEGSYRNCKDFLNSNGELFSQHSLGFQILFYQAHHLPSLLLNALLSFVLSLPSIPWFHIFEFFNGPFIYKEKASNLLINEAFLLVYDKIQELPTKVDYYCLSKQISSFINKLPELEEINHDNQTSYNTRTNNITNYNAKKKEIEKRLIEIKKTI